MKKIIVALDGLKNSADMQHYAADIAKKSGSFLTGVFLDDFTHTSYKIYDLITKEGVSEKELRQYSEKDKLTRENAVGGFEKICSLAGIEYNIHHDKNIALQELVHETIYADMLIINYHETFSKAEERAPTSFIRDMLPGAACPVLLLPGEYRPVEKLVLLYDGEPSSVYAIKTFSHLFATIKDLPTEVICVKNLYADSHLPDNRLMKEFTKRHFPDAGFTILKGHPQTEIIHYLKKEKKNTLVVLGAYKRGTVSRWVKESMADTLMREINTALFIAHNK